MMGSKSTLKKKKNVELFEDFEIIKIKGIQSQNQEKIKMISMIDFYLCVY